MNENQIPEIKNVAANIEKKSEELFAAIFDFKFQKFATIKIVTVVYVLGIIGALYAAYTMATADEEGGFIVGALFFAFLVLILRVILEFIVVQFRTAENTSRLVDLLAKNERDSNQTDQTQRT